MSFILVLKIKLMEDGSLWKWLPTSSRNAVTCWRSWARCTAMMQRYREGGLTAEERLRFHQQHSSASDGGTAQLAGSAVDRVEDRAQSRAWARRSRICCDIGKP